MKRLLIMLVLAAMLGICASSDAYILVYKGKSTIKTVETDVNLMMNKKVSTYLALDINNIEEVVDNARMVLYGKDVNTNKVFYFEDFAGSPRVDWTEEGDLLTVEIVNHRSIFAYDYRFTGKIKEKDVGFGLDDLRSAASSLKGSMMSTNGSIFDVNQVLFGSGSASMTLDLKNTRLANTTPLTIDQIVTNFIDGENGLVEKEYQEFVLP